MGGNSTFNHVPKIGSSLVGATLGKIMTRPARLFCLDGTLAGISGGQERTNGDRWGICRGGCLWRCGSRFRNLNRKSLVTLFWNFSVINNAGKLFQAKYNQGSCQNSTCDLIKFKSIHGG